MAKQGFNLTANLTINTLNLASSVSNIQNTLNKVTGTIHVNVVDKNDSIGKLQAKIEALKTFAASGISKIGVEVSGATAKQIENFGKLARTLKRYRDDIRSMKRSIEITVKVPSKAEINRISELGVALQGLSPIFDSFASKKINIDDSLQNVAKNINNIATSLQQVKGIKSNLKNLSSGFNNFSSSVTSTYQNIDSLLGGSGIKRVASDLDNLSGTGKSLASSMNIVSSSISKMNQSIDSLLGSRKIDELQAKLQNTSLGILPGKVLKQTSDEELDFSQYIDQGRTAQNIDSLLGVRETIKKIKNDLEFSINKPLSRTSMTQNTGYVDIDAALGLRKRQGISNTSSPGLNEIIKEMNRAKMVADMAATSINKSEEKIKKSASTTATSINRIGEETKKATSFMYDFGKSGGLAVKRFGAFTIATTVVFGFINAIGQAFREAVEFEKQLAKIAQVSNTSILGVKNLGDEVGRLAVQYGIASGQLLKINQIFAQAGLRGYELQQALNAIAKSDLAPTFTDMENTSEGLIAMMGQFNIQANDFEKALGSINAVSAEFAVESDDLISAIRIFGGVFAKASNETKPGLRQLQELLAIFTGIRDTTRESAESIATGLRTITTRLQRPRTANLLKSYGIDVRDQEDNFIGMYEAVEELNKKLKTMNKLSEGYAKISEEIGGYRQKGKTIPLTEQIDKMQKALNIARQGEGSLTDQMDTQLQTLSRRAIMVAEDFKKMIREIMNTESFKRIVDVVLTAAEAFVKLADSIKPILPLLSVLAVVRGGVGAFQFAKGAIDQLKHNQTSAVGAGIRSVQAGGISGFGGGSFLGGLFKNKYGSFSGIASGFDPNVTTHKFYNRALGGIQTQYNTPNFQNSLSKIFYNISKDFEKAYGNSSKQFYTAIKAATTSIVRNINANANQIPLAMLESRGRAAGNFAVGNMRRRFGFGISGWRKLGANIGGIGRGLADRSAPLLMGGMLLSSAGGGHPATNIIGKTLSGAGIGGMIGGPWGVAIGAITGGVMGIVQAMGPEKIQRANDALAKALEDVSKKFDDFGRYDLKNVNDDLGSVVKDLEKAMFDAFNINKKPPIRDTNLTFGGYEYDPTFGGIERPENIEEINKRRMEGINKQNEKARQEELNRAGEVYQKFAPKAKEAFGYLGQIIKEEGSLFKNGELDVEKVKGIESKYGKGPGFIESLLNISSLGGKDSNLAAQNIAKILFGGADAEKARKVMEAIWQARNNELLVIRESEKKVEDLVFAFDKMRFSLEQLDSMVSRVAEKNKLLALTTDQYFDNAISGPASNRIIFTKPQNPFSDIEGSFPAEIRRNYEKMGINPNSQLGNTLFFGSILKEQLPQLVETAKGLNQPEQNQFLLKELFGGTREGLAGGLISEMDAEIRDRLFRVIENAGSGDGSIEISKLSERLLQIVDPEVKKAAEVFSKEFEMLSEQTQRIVDIVGKRLELEQRLRNDELNLIQQRQGFSEQRANLFYEEDPFQKGQRLAANRAEVMTKLSGGKNFSQLFDEREGLRKKLDNLDTKDEAGKKVLEGALLENQNEINKLTESLQKASDVNEQLANIQQQSLKFQQKREAGRTLVGRIQSMGFAERADYMRGLSLAIQMRKQGGLPNNIASKDFDRIQRAISLVSEYKDVLPKAEQKAIEEMTALSIKEWNRISETDKLNGPVSAVAMYGGTERGESTEEKALLGAFDTLAKSASFAASELIKMVEEDKKRALKKFEFEKQEAKKGINQTIIRANQAFIVRDSGKKEEVEDLGGGGAAEFAKGGKLGGSGPIPILAHGGELIVPKNKVNQGLAGVVDFAKSQGLVFEKGGKVPTLAELKKGVVDQLQQFPVEEYREIYPEIEKQLSDILNSVQRSKNKVDLSKRIDDLALLGLNIGGGILPEPLVQSLGEIRTSNLDNMLSWREKPESAYESAKKQQRMAYDSRRKENFEKRYGKKLTDEDKEKRRQQINEIASKRAIPIKKKQSILDRFKRGVVGEQTSFSAKEALGSDAIFEYIETPLGDVLKFLEDAYAVKINANYGYTGYGPDTPITANLKGISLDSGLKIILKRLGLEHEIRNNEIFIDTPEGLENEKEIQKILNMPQGLREYDKNNPNKILPQEFFDIRERSIARNAAIDAGSKKAGTDANFAAAVGYNEFNAPLKTYRPEEYNKRYGKGFAVGYEENRGNIKAQFQETNAVKAKRAAEEADLKRFEETKARSKSLIGEGQKLSDYKQLGIIGRSLLRSEELDISDYDKLYKVLNIPDGDLGQRASDIANLIAKYSNLVGPASLGLAQSYGGKLVDRKIEQQKAIIRKSDFPINTDIGKPINTDIGKIEDTGMIGDRNLIKPFRTLFDKPESLREQLNPRAQQIDSFKENLPLFERKKGSAPFDISSIDSDILDGGVTKILQDLVPINTNVSKVENKDIVGDRNWIVPFRTLFDKPESLKEDILGRKQQQDSFIDGKKLLLDKTRSDISIQPTEKTESLSSKSLLSGIILEAIKTNINKIIDNNLVGDKNGIIPFRTLFDKPESLRQGINKRAEQNYVPELDQQQSLLKRDRYSRGLLSVDERDNVIPYAAKKESLDDKVRRIAKEFGVTGINLLPSEIMPEQESKRIAKVYGLDTGENLSAYYSGERRIRFGNPNIPESNIRHEFGHAIYDQKGLEKDPYVQKVIGDATDHLKRTIKDKDEFNKKFGPDSYIFSPSEMFANIMRTDNEVGMQYKNKILEYLRGKQNVPGFASGTPEVTRTGQALIHKGEAILPASEITAFANAIRMATESMKGFGAGKNVGGVGDNGRTAVDEALIKAANTLSQINIPEKIVLEFPSAIQHQVTFNNGDILSEKISNLIGEKVNQMIQRQITSVISPVDGSTLIG